MQDECMDKNVKGHGTNNGSVHCTAYRNGKTKFFEVVDQVLF